MTSVERRDKGLPYKPDHEVDEQQEKARMLMEKQHC